ncbi:hypothetical protein KVT40_002871 [Elsinoe batatas]|uniref:Uncharacterized protein n=1 Tax=Elsinoe batatas TaxID=2601811 RepID=A0A8K0L316_9PEZI|nr:hypothetical protein KVT40_002871 [Elsinoe batatas]
MGTHLGKCPMLAKRRGQRSGEVAVAEELSTRADSDPEPETTWFPESVPSYLSDTAIAELSQTSPVYGTEDQAFGLSYTLNHDDSTLMKVASESPDTLDSPIQAGRWSAVALLLGQPPSALSTIKYCWALELLENGFSSTDVLEILKDRTRNSPWIVNKPTPNANDRLYDNHHLAQCSHQLARRGWAQCDKQKSTFGTRSSPSVGPQRDVVDQYCGLAGIVPVEVDKAIWTSAVVFSNDYRSCRVTYAKGTPETDREPFSMSRLHSISSSACRALGGLQQQGKCCDGFTTIIHSLNNGDDVLKLVWISAESITRVFKALHDLLDISTAHQTALQDLSNAVKVILSLFCVGEDDQSDPSNEEWVMHRCALALQAVCIGISTYTHAHVGPFQSNVLEHDLDEVVLAGTADASFPGCLYVNLYRLACLDGLTKSPVLGFSWYPSARCQSTKDDGKRYRLLCKAADFLDTFGPGSIAYAKETLTERSVPVAIMIGGGVLVSAENDSGLSAQSSDSSLNCHWSKEIKVSAGITKYLDLERILLVGSAVTTNVRCRSGNNFNHSSFNSMLEPLGTFRAHWETKEKEKGVQVGQYIQVQGVHTAQKVPGRTLKEATLSSTDIDLIEDLEKLRGLQVSLCTGLARRATLREVVTDVLPIYAARTGVDQGILLAMGGHSNLIAKFGGTRASFRVWYDCLLPEQRAYLLNMVRDILSDLQHTGITPETSDFVAAWPSTSDTKVCLKFSSHGENEWIRLLEDDYDCATFAIITPLCLESNEDQCCPSPATWKGTIASLATEVSLSRTKTVGGSTNCDLADKSEYYIRKSNIVLKVTVDVSKAGMTYLRAGGKKGIFISDGGTSYSISNDNIAGDSITNDDITGDNIASDNSANSNITSESVTRLSATSVTRINVTNAGIASVNTTSVSVTSIDITSDAVARAAITTTFTETSVAEDREAF